MVQWNADCRRMIGRDIRAWNQIKIPVYGWYKGHQNTCATGGMCDNSLLFSQINDNLGNSIQANRDYYDYTASFTRESGVGIGTLANRPTTCTTGIGYWATDQGNWNQSGRGGQGVLYKCSSTNTWTLYYRPYNYPDPLQGLSDTAEPTGLQGK